MAKHLAVFDSETVKKIFEGRKTVDGRFSQIRIAPFLNVLAGDVVYIKISGEEIVGQFVVDRVFYFDHPKREELEDIKKKYGKMLGLSESFWRRREKVNYVSLMFIRTVSKLLIAPEIPKRDLRPWVVLEAV